MGQSFLPSVSMNTISAILVLGTVAMAAANPTEGTPTGGPPEGIPSNFLKQEKASFKLCESDGEDGLTWAEVEICEVEFSAVMEAAGMAAPTEDDFNASD